MELPKLKKLNPNGLKKKKILLMCDDMRVNSGVGTMARHIVQGTINKYDWIQIGGAINHPDQGKIFDLKDEGYNFTLDDAKGNLQKSAEAYIILTNLI